VKKVKRSDPFLVARIILMDWNHWKLFQFRPALDLLGSEPKRSLFRQLKSFAAVGAAAGVLDYLVMVFLRESLSVDAVISALAGYVFGSIASYTLNRLQTFRSIRPHSEAVWRFATVNVIGFGATGLLMTVLVNIIHIDYLISRAFTIVAISSMNFVSYKFWTFSMGTKLRRES
jgi:putative flippase GtrA